MERRVFVKAGLSLIALPLLEHCKTGGGDAAVQDAAAQLANPLLHNMRYENIPCTTSNLRISSDFASDAQLLKSHVEDILNSGKFAKFRVRGGGHSYIGASLAKDAYVLNMAPFNRIEVDKQAGTVKVGAGCLFHQISPKLAATGADLYLATGDCPTVGVTGYHTGGGQSILSPALGLGVDRVASATILTFKKVQGRWQGELLTISPKEHADLYWAVLGGSGQFGVITDLTLRYTELKNWSAYSIYMRYDNAGVLGSLFKGMNQLCKKDLHPTTSFKLQANRSGEVCLFGAFAESSGDEAKLRAFATSHGGSMKKQPMSVAVLAESFSGCESLENCSTTAWTIGANYQAAKSTLLPPEWELTDQMAEWLAQRIKGNRVADTAYIQFQRWSGVMVQDNPTVSFPFRKFSYEVQVLAATANHDTWTQAAWFDKWVDEVTWFLGERKAAFFNHVHAEVVSNKELYFGSAWSRLQQVKESYDPEHVFDALTPAA